MNLITYSISDAIFEQFPQFFRGVVVAEGVANRKSPPELIKMLREEERSLRQRIMAETMATEPRIISWREAFRSLGIKISEYRPSVEAMARRVINGHNLPDINALVDIGNIISLRYLLPVGGHSLNNVASDLSLRSAHGSEEFIPFGSDQIEHPDAGEFIFAEANHVLTRRWVWRQSNHTITELSTTAIEFNLDGLPPLSTEDILACGREIEALVGKFCGGKFTQQILDKTHPEMVIGLTNHVNN
jgi:DNA/RNA-binding domain of Phe-tRNA-synthetase-like protein